MTSPTPREYPDPTQPGSSTPTPETPETPPQPRILPVTYRQSSAITATINVDGTDLTNSISRITIDHHGGKLPQIFLELARGKPIEEITVEGIVHVIREVKEDPADACLRFLEPIDPAELDRCVLEAMELGGPKQYGEAALHVLRGWARGD